MTDTPTGGVLVWDEPDSHGGTIRHIDATVISGKKRITANGSDIDVTNYASVDVAIAKPVGAVSGRLHSDGTLRGRLSAQGGLSGGLSIGTTSAFPVYDGPYEVTPTLEMQALDVGDM